MNSRLKHHIHSSVAYLPPSMSCLDSIKALDPLAQALFTWKPNQNLYQNDNKAMFYSRCKQTITQIETIKRTYTL